MDFHTMVSSFKRSVLEEEEISELTKASRDRVERYIKDGTPGRHTPRFSFENLFGGQDIMRVMIPLGTEIAGQATDMFERIVARGWKPAFTFKKVVQKMRDVGGREYEKTLDLPVLTMKKEVEKVIPKGPRAGEKITSVQKISLGKLVERFGTDEDKAWWKENQNSLREMDNVQKYFLKPYLNSFTTSVGDSPQIVISRHPIDVARMSDFSTTRSCHSEGSSHFNCAIDESKGHGMVAYLVRGRDVKDYDLVNRINDEEIFGDQQVNFDGPEPIARVRIYKLHNTDTEQDFGVAESRVYGVNVPDFLPAVRQWLRQNQRDMWADEEGNIDPSAIGNGDFIRIGGSYADAEQSGGEIGDLVAALFKDTPLEEQADDIFGGVGYRHEDYYDEESSDLIDIASNQVVELVNAANRILDDGDVPMGVYADVEEGWDDIPFYVQGGFSVDFKFEYNDEWDNNENRPLVPDYRSSWQHQREFAEEIYTALYDKANIYGTGNQEIESSEENNEITISYRDTFEFETTGMESVEQLEYQIDEALDKFNDGYNTVYGVIRKHLIEEGYLPAGAFEQTVQKLTGDDFKGYKNLSVLYDEEDPGDGIEIINKETDPAMSMLTPYGFAFHKVAKVDGGAVGPFSVLAAYQNDLRNPQRREQINASIRSVFKKMANEAFKYSLKQVPLPFDKKFQAKPKNMRDMMPMSFSAELGTSTAELEPKQFDVGVRFKLKIDFRTSQEEIDRVEAFVEYLDEHIDVLYKAAERVAQNLRKQVASQLETQPVVQFEENTLREAIKKAIKERLLSEQSEFETRMFQVNLKIQVDSSIGGGIEQKLNRIRAIEGVTVVSHDEPQTSIGRETIEARIKFHPDSDALRPGTYVTQILVPEINSSKLVPGVKVIDIVRGSLKRLDK